MVSWVAASQKIFLYMRELRCKSDNKNDWFAACPSGTVDIYKTYAECFLIKHFQGISKSIFIQKSYSL